MSDARIATIGKGWHGRLGERSVRAMAHTFPTGIHPSTWRFMCMYEEASPDACRTEPKKWVDEWIVAALPLTGRGAWRVYVYHLNERIMGVRI